MFCAVAACHAVAQWHAVTANPHGVADLDGGILFACHLGDGASGAYLRAFGAFGTAVATFIRHLRLHESIEFRRGTQHIVWADLNTQLAACTT